MKWRRARLILVGPGRSGKTAFLRALRNLPFKHTESTAGIDTDIVEATDVHNWTAVDGNEYEQVMVLLRWCSISCIKFMQNVLL